MGQGPISSKRLSHRPSKAGSRNDPTQVRRTLIKECEDLPFSSKAGKVGLTNLGNTCFMNAGLQCLSHLEPLATYFLRGRYIQDINISNPMGNGGAIARAFADLQSKLWMGEESPHSPRRLRGQMALFAPHLFEGYEQQDAQEFLAFFLDGLHEDMNRVLQKPSPLSQEEEQENERLAESQGHEFASALAWRRHLERGKSFLVDLFQGQLRSSVRCTRCGYCSSQYDPFLYLSVPVEQTMASIADTLERYLEDELLSGDEQWFCSRCKEKVDARKKIELWKLPLVLVLHLKRFKFDRSTATFQKIGVPISVEANIDLTNYCSSAQKQGAVYSPACVANHHGAFGCGHYTATCRVGDTHGGGWYYFDDSNVYSLPDGEDPVGRDAYVIFLIRRPPHSERGLPKELEVTRQSLIFPEHWPHMLSERNSFVSDILNGRRKPHPLKEGWLYESCADGGELQRHWWVLRQESLVSYPTEDSRERLVEIAIAPSISSHRVARGHAFVLDTDLRQYHLDARTAEALGEWMRAIAEAVASQSDLPTLASFLGRDS